MNKFATIVPLHSLQLNKVKYYSIQFEDSDVTEFEDFLNRMEEKKEIEEDLNNLMVWIDEIGDKYGAQDKFFRHEGYFADLSALPPPQKVMKLQRIEVENIRLYCLKANKHVVFLFNGGIKTKQKAQYCPNVGPYFKQANQIVKAIEALFHHKDIQWNNNQTDIIFDQKTAITL